MYLLGIVIYLILVFISIVLNEGILISFFNLSSLCFVLLGTFSILLSSGYITEFFKSFRYLIFRKSDITGIEKERMANAMDISYKSSILTGIFGFIIGIVIMLSNFSGMDYMGPKLAFSLISLFNGLFFGIIVFYPAKLRIKG